MACNPALSGLQGFFHGQQRCVDLRARRRGWNDWRERTVGEIAALSHTVDALVAESVRQLDASVAAILAKSPDIDDIVLTAQLANSKGQVMIGQLALRAAEQLFDTGGGSATAWGRNLDRHWRNVRTLCNHNPAALRARVLGDYLLNGERADFDEGRVF